MRWHWARAAATVAMLAIVGCGDDARGARWSFRFEDDTLAARAVAIQARILEGGCAGSRELYVAEIDVSGSTDARVPPRLGPGQYGLSGRARDAACRWYAAGCIDVTLPASEGESFQVPLAANDMGIACEPDAGMGLDGGGDAGPRPDAGTDAGPPPDAGRDAGPGPCTPGTSCSADGTQLLTCSTMGGETTMSCDRGCTAGACRPETRCSTTPEVAVIPFDAEISTCGTTDGHDPVRMGDCIAPANGEDTTYRINVPRRQRYRLEVEDASLTSMVDPVIYLRRGACGSESTQIACNDDHEAAGNARIEIDLDPGDYFLIVDTYDYDIKGTSFGCGTVRVRIDPV